MRLFNFFLIFALCSLPGRILAQDLPDYRCEMILGDWSGVYLDDGTSWLSGSYQFDGAYDEDGSVIIDFNFLDSDETDRHEGYWLCDNGVLTTGLATRLGGSILYHYQILDINQDSWTYRLISPEPGAPTFHAKRVGARIMIPEIFNSLEN